MNESLAKLNIWVEDKKHQEQKSTHKGLEVIFEAVDEVLNNTAIQPDEHRTAVIVPNAASALFKATNVNPSVQKPHTSKIPFLYYIFSFDCRLVWRRCLVLGLRNPKQGTYFSGKPYLTGA